MAQAARSRTYSTRSSAAPRRAPQRNVTVIPGRRSDNPAYAALSAGAISTFKIALVLIAIIAVVCSVRVWLSAQTVINLQQVSTLESELETATAYANELEIQHSILSSSERIEARAAALGMVKPAEVDFITVTFPNELALNSAGAVSVAGTIDNIEATAAITTK